MVKVGKFSGRNSLEKFGKISERNSRKIRHNNLFNREAFLLVEKIRDYSLSLLLLQNAESTGPFEARRVKCGVDGVI